jgi:putative ABC transport system permease protein
VVLLLALVSLAHAGGGAGALREVGRGSTPSRRSNWVRKAFVVAQIALSVVLLAGSAMLSESFRRMSAVAPGFDPHGVLTFRVVLPARAYTGFPAVTSLYAELARRLEETPGVEAAGLASSLPLSGFDGCSSVFVEGAQGEAPCVPVHVTTPGFFRALGVPVRGRAPGWGEVQAGSAGVVVSEALARRLWPGEAAQGKGITTSSRAGFYRVSATVAGLREAGLDQPPSEALYLPLLPAAGVEALMGGPPRTMGVALRTRVGSPEQLLPAVRATLADLDPRIAIADVRPMDEMVSRSMARVSFAALLLALACAVAVVLSLVGMYGVVSYLVGQRMSEIGVRVALGAPSRQVGWLVLRQSLRMALAGAALGLAASLAATRSIRALLFEVSPGDPVLLAAAGVVLVLAAAAASFLPVRRAMRVNPADLLRRT